jgi:hypothetical protein
MSKDLATQTKGSLAVVPDHLKQYIGAQDAENEISTADILIPRLSVGQDGMSPQLKKANELFIPGLEPGQLFNTVTNEIFGETAVVIPLFFRKNYIKFAGKGVLKVVAMYANASDVPKGGLDWKVDSEGKRYQEVTEFKERMSLIRTASGAWQPIIVSFKKGEVKFSDQWNSAIKFAKLADRLPAFAHTYTVTAKLKQGGEGKSWYVKTVAPLGFTPENIFTEATAYFEQLSKGGYVVDNAGLEPEADDVEGDASFDAPSN